MERKILATAMAKVNVEGMYYAADEKGRPCFMRMGKESEFYLPLFRSEKALRETFETLSHPYDSIYSVRNNAGFFDMCFALRRGRPGFRLALSLVLLENGGVEMAIVDPVEVDVKGGDGKPEEMPS